MDPAAIDWFTDATVAALGRGETPQPDALLLLVRAYARTGRDDLAEALGPALARVLETWRAPSEAPRCSQWLSVMTEAAAISEDERLRAAVSSICSHLACIWPEDQGLVAAMSSIDACLAAAGLLGDAERSGVIRAAVDELERIVTTVYRPGEGLACSTNGVSSGDLADHVATASALVTAYEATARLPYSMLAEELVQVCRRRWWDQRGCFVDSTASTAIGREDTLPIDVLLVNCRAVRVLCRIAALHRDPTYQQTAVLAPGSDYAVDARCILASLASSARRYPVEGAMYALALDEYLQQL